MGVGESPIDDDAEPSPEPSTKQNEWESLEPRPTVQLSTHTVSNYSIMLCNPTEGIIFICTQICEWCN